MINLKEIELSIKTPISSLEKMGKIESTEKIESFFEKYIRYVESNDDISLNSNSLNFFKNSNFINIFFVPIIIKNMIITNKKFSEVVELSKDEIRNKIYEMEQILFETELDFQKIISFLGDLLKYNKENSNKKDIINCKLNNLSDEFMNSLSIYGVDKISERVAVEVYDNINNNLITPVNQAFNESYNEIFDNIQDKEKIVLEQYEREEFVNMCKVFLEESSKKLYFSIPMQTIISEVITKAIEEDLTFMKALLQLDFSKLVEKTIENIEQESSLLSIEEIKELTKIIIKFALDFM